jgi:Cysteine-rich secretory protein family
VFINTLNRYREDNSLPPLLIDPSLQASADWMSNDLGTRADHVFDHTDSTGRDPWTRMCDFGYCYNTWKGENIAAGYVTAADVFAAWKASPGHNANMLGPNYRVMGLARVYTQGSIYGWYWTNDFGGEIADSAPSPPPTPTDTPTPTATPTPVPASPTSSPTPFSIVADVNCDSHVTGADSVRILQFVAQVTESTPACPPVGSAEQQTVSSGARYLGDVDCNGVVDARDALAILSYLASDPAASTCGR